MKPVFWSWVFLQVGLVGWGCFLFVVVAAATVWFYLWKTNLNLKDIIFP